MPGGRPDHYDPSLCDIFVELSARGCSQVEICARVGMSYDQHLRYQKKYPEYRESVKRGVFLCQAWWETEGRKNMGNRDFNYTGWYMNMKNRFRNSDIPWTDSKEIKHSGGVSVSKESDEELDNRIRSLTGQIDADSQDS